MKVLSSSFFAWKLFNVYSMSPKSNCLVAFVISYSIQNYLYAYYYLPGLISINFSFSLLLEDTRITLSKLVFFQ